jgi:hypothetical protein
MACCARASGTETRAHNQTIAHTKIEPKGPEWSFMMSSKCVDNRHSAIGGDELELLSPSRGSGLCKIEAKKTSTAPPNNGLQQQHSIGVAERVVCVTLAE